MDPADPSLDPSQNPAAAKAGMNSAMDPGMNAMSPNAMSPMAGMNAAGQPLQPGETDGTPMPMDVGVMPKGVDINDPAGLMMLHHQMVQGQQSKQEVKAGLNADPSSDGQLPGPTPVPNPMTDARLLPGEPPTTIEDMAMRALRAVTLAARQQREMRGALIGAKQPMAFSGGDTGKDPWMVGGGWA